MPLKLNSQRVRSKALSDLGGRPLYWHLLSTLSAAWNQGVVDEAVLWCSERIELPAGIQYQTRNKLLDTAETSANDLAREFALTWPADVYVSAFATSPFLTLKTLERCLEIVTSGEADSAFAAHRVCPLAWHGGRPMYPVEKMARTQDMPELLVETTGLYVYTRELALQGIRIHGGSAPVRVDAVEAIDIDYPEHLDLARLVHAGMRREA